MEKAKKSIAVGKGGRSESPKMLPNAILAPAPEIAFETCPRAGDLCSASLKFSAVGDILVFHSLAMGILWLDMQRHCVVLALACLHLLLKVKINLKGQVKLQFQNRGILRVGLISLHLFCSLWTKYVGAMSVPSELLESLYFCNKRNDYCHLNCYFSYTDVCMLLSSPLSGQRPWLYLSA